jgi:cytochrome c oxidase assembly protein subunit 15
MAHFVLSMVLVWNAVVLHLRAGVPDDPGPSRREGPGLAPLARAIVAAAAVVVVTGTVVTASGPHAGDEQADRLGLALPDVTRVHGIAVVVLALAALALLRRAPRGGPSWRATRVLLVVLAAQAAVGYTQYFTGVPALLVGVHICGALAVWIAAVRLPVVVGAGIPVARTASAAAAAGP